MQIGKHSTKWINSAARRRCHLKFRANLCKLTGYNIDSGASTGEILETARMLFGRMPSKARFIA